MPLFSIFLFCYGSVKKRFNIKCRYNRYTDVKHMIVGRHVIVHFSSFKVIKSDFEKSSVERYLMDLNLTQYLFATTNRMTVVRFFNGQLFEHNMVNIKKAITVPVFLHC